MSRSRVRENTGFICQNCGREVAPLVKGSYRNHCPFCLHSLHIDEEIGDRMSTCLGVMEPIAIRYHSKKGYQILHKCKKCQFERYNIVCEDDPQSDDMDLVREIMKKQ